MDDKSFSRNNVLSVEKHNQTDNSISYARGTKERFNNLESNTRSKMNIPVRDNKKFDLENYMQTVDQYNKMKSQDRKSVV